MPDPLAGWKVRLTHRINELEDPELLRRIDEMLRQSQVRLEPLDDQAILEVLEALRHR